MLTNQLDETFIRQVNRMALDAASKGFAPFAALLVKDEKIAFSSIDKCIPYSDPTAHAELIVVSEFCRKNNVISLEGYTLYCNVEPCVMCSGAIHWSKISRVVFSVFQQSLQKVSKGKQKPNCEQLINTGNKKIEVRGGVLEKEGIEVLEKFPFKSKQEQHDAFIKKVNSQKE